MAHGVVEQGNQRVLRGFLGFWRKIWKNGAKDFFWREKTLPLLAHICCLTQITIDVILHSARPHGGLHPTKEIFSLVTVFIPAAVVFCKCAQVTRTESLMANESTKAA